MHDNCRDMSAPALSSLWDTLSRKLQGTKAGGMSSCKESSQSAHQAQQDDRKEIAKEGGRSVAQVRHEVDERNEDCGHCSDRHSFQSGVPPQACTHCGPPCTDSPLLANMVSESTSCLHPGSATWQLPANRAESMGRSRTCKVHGQVAGHPCKEEG